MRRMPHDDQVTICEAPASGVEESDILKLLTAVRSKVRRANFEDGLLAQAESLEKEFDVLSKVDRDLIHWYKALATTTEIYDYFGRFEHARKIIAEEGAKAARELELMASPQSDRERAVCKQKIWLSMHYAQSEYRCHHDASALEIVDRALATIDSTLSTEKTPMFGTRSRLYFLKAHILRHSHKLEEARASYVNAIELSHSRLAEKTARLRAAEQNEAAIRESLIEERAVASRTIALSSALGLGWLDLVTGRLNQARPAIALGRTLLFGTKDWVNQTYVELLYGTLQRLLAGYDPNGLSKAIAILEGPNTIFSTRHRPYQVRSAHQLALAHFYAEDYTRSSQYVDQVQEIAEHWEGASDGKDPWWYCNALIMRSRIFRKQKHLQGALDMAHKAHSEAVKAKEVLCEVDALIAIGEAHFELSERQIVADNRNNMLRDAERCFNEAMRLGQANDQIRAVCALHLASTFLKLKDFASAHEQFNVWCQLERNIENGVVRFQAQLAKEELDRRQDDFIVSAADPDLNYDRHVAKLREFLIDTASRRAKTQDQIADLLGTTRQTLYNWDAPKKNPARKIKRGTPKSS